MKIIINPGFSLRQREVIRVAAIVAAANFPMPYKVEVSRMPKQDRKDWDGCAVGNHIWLAGNLHGAALFATASHEFCHVSQQFTGKLELSPDDFYWKGRKVPARMRYENQPHEKEAFGYEHRLIPKRKMR